MDVRYADGHECGVQPLFAESAGELASGAGDWVQLAPVVADAAALGRQRAAVEATGGRLLAVVPEALLWSGDLPDAERFVHLDCRREALVVTALEGAERLAVTGVQVERELGAATIEKGILRGVAEWCVRETRYDPQHNAAAEGELTAVLRSVMGRLLAGEEATVRLGGGELRVAPGQLAGWCQPTWARVAAIVLREFVTGTEVLLSPAAGALPNLRQALRATFGDGVRVMERRASRERAALDDWLGADLPGYGCWLLQTRPRGERDG